MFEILKKVRKIRNVKKVHTKMCLIFNFISILLEKAKLSMATCHMETGDPCSEPNEYW